MPSAFLEYPESGSYQEQLNYRLGFDFPWVCEHLLRITDKATNDLVPFCLNDVQRYVYWHVRDMELNGLPVRLWILKGRQMGISTLFCARQFVKAALHGDNCLLLAHLEAPGKVMFGKIERIIRSLPTFQSPAGKPIRIMPKPSAFHQGDYIAWSGQELNSLIRRESAENKNAGVSETYQHIHSTELPLWSWIEHTMGGLLPTLPSTPGTTFVGEFTARVQGDYTHNVWLDAVRGLSPFRAVFLPWYWHAEYQRPRLASDTPLTHTEREYRALVARTGSEFPLEDSPEIVLKAKYQALHSKRPLVPDDLASGFTLSDTQLLWRRDRIKEFRGDIDIFRREYPSTHQEAWLSSSRRLIPPTVMDRQDAKENHQRELDRGEYEIKRAPFKKAKRLYVVREDGRFYRWEEPAAKATYVIGADTSSGTHLDYSGIQVLRVHYHLLDQVASFQGKVRPHDLARLLARVGSHYKSGMEWDEDSKKLTGGKPSLLVIEKNYHGEHVIYELVETIGYRRLYRHDKRGQSDNWRYQHDYGFLVTKRTKMPMLLHLGQLLHDDQLRIRCVRTRQEVRNLIYLDDLGDTAGAPRGLHDDLAMSLGEAAFVASQTGAFRRVPGSDDVNRHRHTKLWPVSGF